MNTSGVGNEVGILGYSDVGGNSLHVDEVLQNVAVGPNLTLFTGKRNVILGTKAGLSATRSDDNVFGGWAAGGGAGDSNVIVGTRAGQYLEEQSTYSVVVGPLAAFGASVVSNSVLIGPRVGGDLTTSLNSTIIGTGVVASDKVADVSVVARDTIIGDDSNEYAERITGHVSKSWLTGTDIVAFGNAIVTMSGRSGLVAIGDAVTAGGSDSILVGKNVSTGTGGSLNQIFGMDTHILGPHVNVLSVGAGPIQINRSNMEFIGTGIVYDKESNTMELLKGALKLSGDSLNFGNGILVIETDVGMTTQNAYNINSTFENQLTLTHTDDAGYIDNWTIKIEVGDFEQYNLVFRSLKGTRVVFADDYEPGVTNFTGQHRCLLCDEDIGDVEIGHIVCSTGKYAGLSGEDVTIDESIPIVKICTDAEDPTVFGVVSDVEHTGNARSVAVGHMKFILPKPFSERRVRVNGAGEGGILVCNEGGDIRNGDLLCSSSTKGYAMKQDSIYVTNYTCAKATCNANFSAGSSTLIGCVYKF
jgi:hypothetical protein